LTPLAHPGLVRLLMQIRLHLCPFVVAHADAQERGFAFVQSPSTLLELHLARPVSHTGRRLERSVLVHFMVSASGRGRAGDRGDGG
jgi:hypothetical protein